MKILVTGATGKLGSKVVQFLLKKIPTSEIAVSVRDTAKAESLSATGIEVRKGDFDDPVSLVETFKGIDKLLIISTDGDTETRIRQHNNAVQAAVKANVKHIIYTSLANAQKSTLFLAAVHKATEDAILATGIPYTFLRNNWYLENESSSIKSVLTGAPWLTSAGEGKVGWALQQDYAEAAAAVLAEDGHENKIYELSGKPLSQKEFVDHVEKVINKEVALNQVDDETYGTIMKKAGVPAPFVPFLIAIQVGIRENALNIISDDFEELLKHPLTDLETGIKQIIY